MIVSIKLIINDVILIFFLIFFLIRSMDNNMVIIKDPIIKGIKYLGGNTFRFIVKIIKAK